MLSFFLTKLRIAKPCLTISLILLFVVSIKKEARANDKIPRIKIKEVNFIGNTVFPDSELKKILPSFTEPVSIEKLFYLRKIITDYYVKKGFLSSGAFIPPQKLTGEELSIQVVEGKLAKIEIEGLKKIKKGYVLNKLPKLNRPLNLEELAERLKELQKNPSIASIETNLTSSSIGKNNLKLTIKEEKPFKSELSITNGYSPSVGTLGGTMRAHYHLFGVSDFLSLEYGRTEGLKRMGVGYTIPVETGAISLKYTNADTEAVEEPVSALDIQADFEALNFGVSQTIAKIGNGQIGVGIELESITSETFIDGDFSFAFVEGLEDGRSKINALRLSQNFSQSGENSQFIATSQFNIGLDIFDTTINDSTGADGLYWSWQGQTQWLREFSSFSLLSSLSLQLSPDRLLPLEQIAIGGFNSVRGYRQNLLIGDNGVSGSLELRYPIYSGNVGQFSLIPFFDLGAVWSNSIEEEKNDFLASIGLGISYELNDSIRARLDYGIPLVELDEELDSNSGTQSINFLFSIIP